MNKSTVTISDVAKAAGVTRGTIDRVLHERGEVSEETRAKVLKVIKDLGYKTNVYASMLAKNKSHDIAVILPNFGNLRMSVSKRHGNMPEGFRSMWRSAHTTSTAWILSSPNAGK